MIKKIVTVSALITCLLFFPACNDDDDDCVSCPGGTPRPTMENIWPNADGTMWTFDSVYRYAEQPAPTKQLESTVPSMEELHAALALPIPGVITEETAGLYRLGFDGALETDSGATGQRVVEEYFTEFDGLPLKSDARTDPLLMMIAQARPDLRPAVAARLGMDAKEFVMVPGGPYFLGGYCFSAETGGYYGYGDLDRNRSWVYLEGDLSVGSEFSLQLAPMVANDIWLHGRIWSIGDKTVNGHDYRNVLECMYLVDMGEQNVTDETGTVIGTYHPYMYGTSFFVPGLGPVAGVERRYFGPSTIIQDDSGFGMVEFVLDLVGVGYGD